ncbi:hypothetical protein PoB_003242700 [Plakobranchus ocellatus]|uniref:Uncharacterized protein n=1 Tax=Plakobranchus ocellatus TaxID=259542 RepID=A0AAV4AG90_9GAST|nr:hypothetical protein PoB_003242700 [Plakobranchus ocellatus]
MDEGKYAKQYMYHSWLQSIRSPPNSSAADSALPISTAAPQSTFSKSPADVVGYPKAPERKQRTRGRKRGRSVIATPTPEICRLQLDLLEKEKRSKCTRKSKKQLFGDQQNSDSDLDLRIDDILDSDSESVGNSQPEEDMLELGVSDNPRIKDFVLCEYAMKTKIV